MHKWKAILVQNIEATDVGRMMRRHMSMDSEYGGTQVILADVSANKSTNTLAKRANALMRYMAWMASRGKPICPLDEELMYF